MLQRRTLPRRQISGNLEQGFSQESGKGKQVSMQGVSLKNGRKRSRKNVNKNQKDAGKRSGLVLVIFSGVETHRDLEDRHFHNYSTTSPRTQPLPTLKLERKNKTSWHTLVKLHSHRGIIKGIKRRTKMDSPSGQVFCVSQGLEGTEFPITTCWE